MKKQVNKLIKLRGVGDVLAKRLVESGLDDYEKVAAAGEEGLLKIKGMNPRAVPAIVSQAVEMAANSRSGKSKREEELKHAAVLLKERVQVVAVDVRNRFNEEITGKMGKKVEKEILKVISSLEKVETKLRTRGKRAARGLAKAEKRLDGLQEVGLNKVRKGLQKARKSLKRVLA
jgi:hypothetical protein